MASTNLLGVKSSPYNILCISGGGVRIISDIGALESLESAGLLSNINEYLGVSAGAAIVTSLCIGYSPQELKDFIFNYDFSELRSVDPTKFLEYDEHFGVDEGEGLVTLCETILLMKGYPKDLTFEQLPAIRKLRIFATDLTTQSVREFSRKLTPSVRIVDALRASMSLPFYFTPVIDPITGHLLTDGGILANYPMVHLNKFEAENAIGLTFDDHEPTIGDVTNVIEFFNRIVSCFWINENKTIYSRYANNTIIIPCSEFPSWNFEITEAEKKQLFECGKDATLQWMQKRKNTKNTNNIRRRSC